MTEILDAIHARRAHKRFDADYVIPDDQLRTILEAGLSAPTAFNIQHWRFVVVRDAEQRRKIAEVAWNQPQVTESAALVVLCADVKAWRNPMRYYEGVPEEIRARYDGMIPKFYEGRDEFQRDEGIRSCGMAAYALMMAAASFDLQTCPMDGFDFGKVGEIIGLPADHEIVMFVAIGKAKGPTVPKGKPLPYETFVFEDRFA